MKYVIIIGASELVFPAYKYAREKLGLGIIAFDYNPLALGMKYADIPEVVSTKDVHACIDVAQRLSEIYEIVGVFTCGADVELTVASVANALKLPSINVEVAERCNDKIKMHQYLDSLQFTQKAKYKIVNSTDSAKEASNLIGLPVFIKPIDNCASRGVQRIESLQELDDAFDLAKSYNTDRSTEILIEECLEGSKHTVEMICYNGEWHLLSIIDTHYISKKWPCETGLNITSLSKELQRDVFNFARNVAKLIGINFSAHKVDVNLSDTGEIKLIELTARLSGGFHCQYASPLAFGSKDILAALKLSVGMPLDFEDIEHKYEKFSAVRALFPEPGIIVEINGVEDAKLIPGVANVIVWKKVGDSVGPYFNSADRPAFIIVYADTLEEVQLIANNAEKTINIETRKK